MLSALIAAALLSGQPAVELPPGMTPSAPLTYDCSGQMLGLQEPEPWSGRLEFAGRYRFWNLSGYGSGRASLQPGSRREPLTVHLLDPSGRRIGVLQDVRGRLFLNIQDGRELQARCQQVFTDRENRRRF